MKAVVFDAHGALEAMQYRDAPDPASGPRDCLLRVRAVALNGFDPMILRGIPGLKTPLPMTPGADIAGEIVALGAEVDRAKWKIGDRVTVIPNQDEGMVGETLRGGASEYFATGERYLLPLPDDVSFVDAACLPVAYGAALRMMETRGQLKAGEKVLVLRPPAGLASAASSSPRRRGARWSRAQAPPNGRIVSKASALTTRSTRRRRTMSRRSTSSTANPARAEAAEWT